ncbi:MAG: cytidylate kinase-like family protein, partial [Muribaculaceae bacterium]|nr:cytidylate kinase-like family protein [Muribaculaceae bacterium]
IKDHDKARDKARRTNRLRAAYYNFYTDKQWGDAASYHITIDSSLIPIPQAARIIAGVIREKFAD